MHSVKHLKKYFDKFAKKKKEKRRIRGNFRGVKTLLQMCDRNMARQLDCCFVDILDFELIKLIN